MKGLWIAGLLFALLVLNMAALAQTQQGKTDDPTTAGVGTSAPADPASQPAAVPHKRGFWGRTWDKTKLVLEVTAAIVILVAVCSHGCPFGG